jgi:hypothetical protein
MLNTDTPLILTNPSDSIGEMNIPMHGNYIRSGKGKDIADTDVLDIELNFRELLKKVPESGFHSTLSLKSSAFRYFTREDDHSVISPS